MANRLDGRRLSTSPQARHDLPLGTTLDGGGQSSSPLAIGAPQRRAGSSPLTSVRLNSRRRKNCGVFLFFAWSDPNQHLCGAKLSQDVIILAMLGFKDVNRPGVPRRRERANVRRTHTIGTLLNVAKSLNAVASGASIGDAIKPSNRVHMPIRLGCSRQTRVANQCAASYVPRAPVLWGNQK